MPRHKKQEIIYTLMMVIVMVYGMICYNVALNVGGMKNMVFGAALGELPIMGTLAFVVDFFVVGPLAKKFAFRMFVQFLENCFRKNKILGKGSAVCRKIMKPFDNRTELFRNFI